MRKTLGELGGEIVPLLGDDEADSAPRIADVALVARNYVEVDVRHCLPSRAPDVDSNVPSIDGAIEHEERAYRVHGTEECCTLALRQVKPIGDVSPRHYQRVAG